MTDRSENLRRAYAARIARRAGARDPRIEAAFAAVPREIFAGPPPWSVMGGGFGVTVEDDPARIYDDVLVAIDPERGINNGQPSLHALAIDALAPAAGDVVIHVGAGAGYYTAILAELVGPSGRVIAYEIDPAIAGRARDALANTPQVEIRARSGIGEDLPKANAVYVSAAASYPVPDWLRALKVGGRLIFPLQAAHASGAMLLVTRPGSGDAWPARFLCSAVFIACEGAGASPGGERLSEAFRRGDSADVRSLRLGGRPGAMDWVRGDGWSLSTGEPG